MLARKVIEWCDQKEEESFKHDNYRTYARKCGCLGFVEGMIDGAIIVGLTFAASGYVTLIKKLAKK